jgi:hypothetical protein
MKLFEDKVRTDLNPAKHLDDSYDFYDRSSFKEVEEIRVKLNDWYGHYPEQDKVDLLFRFRDSFSSAFYELFIHELFRRQGFTLLPHPELPNSTKRPDFLAKKGSIEFYLEAREATDLSDAEKSLKNRTNVLYDTINTMNSPNFFLRINDLNFKSDLSPSGRKIVNFLEKEVVKYDPDILTEELLKHGIDASQRIQYEDKNISITFSLIPKSPAGRNKPGRPIGMYPFHSFWGGSEDSIKTAIERKATRYGKLDKPFIVCVNSTSDKMTDEHDVYNALFGQEKISWSTNPEKRDEKWIRDGGGIFKGPKGAEFTRMTGAFVTNVHPGNLHVVKHWLVKHPFSAIQLDFVNLDLTYSFVNSDRIETKQQKSVKEILEIPDKWFNN